MNKKTLITIIVVPLVLLLIVGIIGARYIFKPRETSVTSVSFVGAEEITIDLDTTTTHQLEWKISPEDADNKNVTFTYDGDDKITVDKTGKVTVNSTNETANPFYAGRVTITTEDGGHTDTVMVRSTTDVPQTLNYDFETNQIEIDETLAGYDEDADAYNIFIGRNYQLFDADSTYTISLNENSAATLMDSSNSQYKANSITATALGEFTMTITNDLQESKTLNFKVIQGVDYLGLPTALDIVDKPENYYIGNQNNYYFDYNIIGSTDYVKMEVFAGDATSTTLTSDATVINKREVKFSDNAEGQKYTIKVSSTLNPSISTSYTFSILDAWNVRNHEELSAAFNDGANQKDSIVLVDNIYLTDADMPEGFLSHNSYSTTNHKGIYTRYANLTFEGNNHRIDASAVSYFAQVGSGEQDDFGHERPSLFQVANYVNNRNSTTSKVYYYSTEFAQMVKEIGDDPTYTNTNTPERLEIRNRQKEYVESLYSDENTTIPKVYLNNIQMVGNGGKNVVDSNDQYMGFRSLCGVKASGAKLYLTGCDVQRFLDGVKGDHAMSITLDDCYVGDMSGFDIYTQRTRYVTIKDSTLGQAGHVTTLMTPRGSDTYVDEFTKYDGVYAFEQNSRAYYDSTTGLPLAAIDSRVTNTTDGAVETNGQVLKLVGDVTFDNWFNLKGPFLEADVTSYTTAQTIKNYLAKMLSSQSAIIFKNAGNLDEAEMNYAIQLESAGSPTNYTYLDRTELNSDSKYTDTYDATTFHKIVLKAQQPTGLPDSINNAQITNSRLNSELMCVGVNFSKLGYGTSYLSSIVIGINPDSGFGDR